MSQAKIQVSLKWMLIVIGVVGAVIGLLGRLWTRNPEMCLRIFRFTLILSYPVAMLMAVYIQRRQTAKNQKQAYVWLLPTIGFGWLLFVLSGCLKTDMSRSLPTKFLVQEKLFVHRDGRLGTDPVVWQELERRFFDDRLSKTDAKLIFAEFEKALKKQTVRPEIQSTPNSQLLRRMASRGWVSDEQLVSLGEVFYGKPTSPPLRLRTTEDQIDLSMHNFGRYFGDSHPTTLLWYATSVKVDGEDLQFKNGRGGRAAIIEQPLEVGHHEIRIELDCALVMYDALPNAVGPRVPGTRMSQSYPNSQWPDKLLKRWTEEVVVPTTVHAPEEELISLTSDTDLNPKPFISFRIDGKNTRGPQPQWILHVSIDKELPVAMSGKLSVKIGENELPANSLVTEAKPRAKGGWAGVQHWKLDPATVKAKTATIEFTPNRKYLERETDVTEIWGRRIIFKNVPLKIRN